MPIPQTLADFNIPDASVSLWLFRKSGRSDHPIFTGRWVQTDDALNNALRVSILAVRNGLTEANPYDLLAMVDDGQCLTIGTDETHADLIVTSTAAELAPRRARTSQQMRNTAFYVVKMTHGEQVVHAVTKADSSWKSKRTANAMTVYFSGEQLGLETHPAFTLSKGVDFFIAGDELVILDRSAFESILNYKAAHSEEFSALQAEQAFIDLFVDTGPLVEFVGTNKLHLRRACAIRSKGLYQDAQFMGRLRASFARAGLNLTFDAHGKIIANPAQCPDIIRALLDHRLHSLFSETFYDVQSATAV